MGRGAPWHSCAREVVCSDRAVPISSEVAQKQFQKTGAGETMAFHQRSLDDRAASHQLVSFAGRGNRGKPTVCFLVWFLFATLLAHAQGVGSSGEITGTITDSSGGALPKATIVVLDTQTGQRRQTATNAVGYFRVTGLPPSTYEVSAQ